MSQVTNILKLVQLKIKQFTNIFSTSKRNQVYLFSSISTLIVFTVYLWFGSFGLWTNLPTITTYYDKLANAFRHGNLSLDEKPDPALLALENPYDPDARAGIKVPTDFSFYNGKYYLYFGVVPALLLTVAKYFGFGIIGDQYPVFIFISGTFIIQSLLIVMTWERFFRNIPSWMVPLAILFGGLISPFAWILTQARFYEAASASGQFFFLLGLYFIISAQNGTSISNKRFMMGGASWALAFSSRPTLALLIGFVILIMVIIPVLRGYYKTKLVSKTVYTLASIGLPLVLGIGIWGLYNWARFDSFFETGFYYELAWPNLQKYNDQLFSPVYVLPNLYNYLFMAPSITDTFPFIRSVQGAGAAKFPSISLPEIYFTRGLTGIVYSTPFMLFASILLFPHIRKRKQDNNNQDNDLFKWTVISLWGSFFTGLATFVSYFWVETRFLLDFMPPLVLLSIIGFWQGYLFLLDKPISRILYVAIAIGLIVISIMIGNLLALSAHRGGFKEFNPVLWQYLYKDVDHVLLRKLFSLFLPK